MVISQTKGRLVYTLGPTKTVITALRSLDLKDHSSLYEKFLTFYASLQQCLQANNREVLKPVSLRGFILIGHNSTVVLAVKLRLNLNSILTI